MSKQIEKRYETFTSLLLRINRYISKIKNCQMEEFGLKGNQVQCLYVLYNYAGGLSFAELCALCDEDKAAVSRTLKDLESKGLVSVISSQDKKYKQPIILTELGEQVSKKVAHKIDNFLQIGSAGISDQDREKLYSTLTTICNNLQVASNQGEQK